MGLLAHMKEDVINPLLSAPVIFQTGTVKAAEYVGSRSKIEMERVKMITKTIIDAETRARTYGSGNEWRKWVHDNVLHMNGNPIYKEILVNLPSGITVALVSNFRSWGDRGAGMMFFLDRSTSHCRFRWELRRMPHPRWAASPQSGPA